MKELLIDGQEADWEEVARAWIAFGVALHALLTVEQIEQVIGSLKAKDHRVGRILEVGIVNMARIADQNHGS